MSSKPEPAIWSRVAGQRIPSFDRCQLTITWMSNIKDIRCKPRLQDLVLTRLRPPCCARRRWAHAPAIHVASHFYHEKRVAWLSISMHACDPVPMFMGLCLAVLRGAGAPLITTIAQRRHVQTICQNILSLFTQEFLSGCCGNFKPYFIHIV